MLHLSTLLQLSKVISYSFYSMLLSQVYHMVPLTCSWEFFPNQKGLIIGLIYFGFCVGSVFFIEFSKRFINPSNQPPDLFVQQGSNFERLYNPDSQVSSNFIQFVSTSSIVIAVLAVPAVLLISKKSPTESPRKRKAQAYPEITEPLLLDDDKPTQKTVGAVNRTDSNFLSMATINASYKTSDSKSERS